MIAAPYILHYAPDNASLVIRIALEEIGAPYETCLVDRAAKAQQSARYRALNPNGLIPVLGTPQGPLFETAAILLWLSDHHGQLGPAYDAPDRGDYLKWLFFLSNTLHPALRRLFYPMVYIGDREEDQARLTRTTQQLIGQHLTILNTRWQAPHPTPPALNIYIACMLRWLALYPADSDKSWFLLANYPALHDALEELEQRDSIRTASLAEGLGRHPFTAPISPNPPEGSAT